MAPSASLVWQRPASWFNSTPRFLAAQRSAVSSLGEEVAQREPLKGFPLDSFGNKRAAALLRSREFQICIAFPMGQSSTYFGSTLFLACKSPLVCKISDDFPAEQQIWKTCPPQGIFALQKSLRAGCDGGRGSSSQRGKSPAQRNFQRKFALRRVGSAKFVVPPTTERSKVRSTPNRYNRLYRAARGARGAAPLCFRRSPEETISKGFLWAISSRRLDTALLCAAKKRGVESPGWQVSASLNWRLPPRTAKTKSTLGRHCQNYRFSPRRTSINSGVVPQQPPMRLAPASTSRSICCANSPDSME